MATFVISDLETQEFTFEEIKFKKLIGSTSLERQWRDEYRATFLAEANDNLQLRPIIKEGGLVQVVHDICLLLSLARSRSISCPYYVTNETDTQRYSLPRGQLFEDKLVQDNRIESYLNTVSQTLRQPGWTEETGFIPSAYYLLERYHHKPGEVGFIFTWIALEVLANTHAQKDNISNIVTPKKFEVVKKAVSKTISEIELQTLPNEKKTLVIQKLPELNRLSTRTRIKKLREKYGWDYITNSLLDKCIKLRNQIMHEASHENIDMTTKADLNSRIATAVQLSLIDLLGGSSYVHNLQELKTRIKGDQ